MSGKVSGMVWELDIPQRHAWVLMSLADHAEHDGTQVFPGNGLTAWKTGYSVSQIKRILRDLIHEFRLLEVVARGGGASRTEYRICIEKFKEHTKAPLPGRGIAMNRGHSYEPGASDPSPVGSSTRARDETSLETSVKNSSFQDEEAGASQASPGAFVGYLREELDGADVPLLRNREDRYASEFNKLIKKGVTDDVLYKACDRIVARWTGEEHRKLTAEQALEDVVNGKAPKRFSRLPVGRASDVNHNGMTRKERDADRRRQMQEVGIASLDESEQDRDLDAELTKMRESA